MAKQIWITQKQLADELGVKVQAVSNWIKRKQIKSKFEPKYRITLVDKNSITVKTQVKSD